MMKNKALVLLLLFSTLSLGAQSLQELTEAALVQSPLIHRSQVQARQAQAKIGQARANQLPQIDLNLNGIYQTNPQSGISIPAGSLGTQPIPGNSFPTPIPDSDIVLVEDPENTYFQIQTVLNQSIFTWGKISTGIALAQSSYDAQTKATEVQELQVVRDLAKAYWGIAYGHAIAQVLDQTESLLSKILEDRTRGFDLGTENLESVLDARFQLSTIQSSVAQTQGQIESGLRGLSLLSGIPLEQIEIAPADSTTDYSGEALSQLELGDARDIISHHPEIQQLIRLQQAADLSLQLSQNSGILRPDIGISLRFEVNGQRIPGLPNWVDSWDSNLTIALGTQMGVFDGLAGKYSVEEAQAQVDEAQLGLELLNNRLTFGLLDSQSTYYHYRAVLEEKEAGLEYSDEQLKNAKVSFDNELITRSEYRGAQLLALQAQLALLSAQLQLKLTEADLAYYHGKLVN